MPIEKLKKPIDWFIATFSVVMMVILVICVVWQVFSRFVLNSPSTMTGPNGAACHKSGAQWVCN